MDAVGESIPLAGRRKDIRGTRGGGMQVLRYLLFGVAGSLGSMLVLGVPTALVPNPIFTRMVPPRPLDYVVLALVAMLAGILAATYARPVACPLAERRTLGGSLLAFVGIACPTCNKVVLALLGTSGALTYFQPLQPVLSLLGLGLLAWAVLVRVRGLRVTRVSLEQPASSLPLGAGGFAAPYQPLRAAETASPGGVGDRSEPAP
jgi:uncharacterized membrane protein